MIAVCSIGCDRRGKEGFASWPSLFELEGDYWLYCNYETQPWVPGHSTAGMDLFHELKDAHPNQLASLDRWIWEEMGGDHWKLNPRFDQDQTRQKLTAVGRNMCRSFAMETDATHLLFIDSDIIPPSDIIPRLLEVDHDAVCGLVYGRGVHSNCQYLFGEKRRWDWNNTTLVELEHGNIGFTMLSRKLFVSAAIRYGRAIYDDGRDHMASDDPCFHLDCYKLFGEWPWLRMDVVGRHVGDLKAGETAQY